MVYVRQIEFKAITFQIINVMNAKKKAFIIPMKFSIILSEGNVTDNIFNSFIFWYGIKYA